MILREQQQSMHMPLKVYSFGVLPFQHIGDPRTMAAEVFCDHTVGDVQGKIGECKIKSCKTVGSSLFLGRMTAVVAMTS